ncbi:MAG: hypothetical protein KJ069_04090 [Anaerolineae bacterium]|nr:hypothetical protein [Anaerolineae bacterium]
MKLIYIVMKLPFSLKRAMLTIVLILVTGLAFDTIASRDNCENPPSVWGARKQQLEEQYKIVICFDQIGYPLRLMGASFERVPTNDRLAALVALEVDLQKYEPEFLDRHLNRVYVFDGLRISGEWYGGTYDAIHKWVYIHKGWLGDDGTTRAGGGFHSEVSSILMRRHLGVFSQEEWSKLNPKDFQYQRPVSTVDNLRYGNTDLIGNDLLYTQGFLNGYGQNTLEDDLNGFAQYLIGKPELLKALTDEYPAIRAKANLLQEYYLMIGYNKQ